MTLFMPGSAFWGFTTKELAHIIKNRSRPEFIFGRLHKSMKRTVGCEKITERGAACWAGESAPVRKLPKTISERPQSGPVIPLSS